MRLQPGADDDLGDHVGTKMRTRITDWPRILRLSGSAGRTARSALERERPHHDEGVVPSASLEESRSGEDRDVVLQADEVGRRAESPFQRKNP